MPERFVILHHTLPDGEHWDLMLEHGDVLATWQLLADPIERDAFPISARSIGDHRKAYLTYEGPISGNRGNVTRVDTGTYELIELSAGRCRFALNGRRISGRFVLDRTGGRWTLTREQEDNAQRSVSR